MSPHEQSAEAALFVESRAKFFLQLHRRRQCPRRQSWKSSLFQRRGDDAGRVVLRRYEYEQEEATNLRLRHPWGMVPSLKNELSSSSSASHFLLLSLSLSALLLPYLSNSLLPALLFLLFLVAGQNCTTFLLFLPPTGSGCGAVNHRGLAASTTNTKHSLLALLTVVLVVATTGILCAITTIKGVKFNEMGRRPAAGVTQQEPAAPYHDDSSTDGMYWYYNLASRFWLDNQCRLGQ